VISISTIGWDREVLVKLEGNKLCPHCGFEHTLFRPFLRPPRGWDCPGCGEWLKPNLRRYVVNTFVTGLALFIMLNFPETPANKLAAMVIVLFGIGFLGGFLALDVRAAD